MKLIVRQYLDGLRERDELDAILPLLLSELGFHVLSRPGRGTRQAGVDVAAVGPDERDEGKEKLFLFVIKSGDLTRADWDGASPQAVRPSINEILDSYIPTRIPEEYRNHEIAICLCMGGETKETVATQWTNFQKTNSREGLCFREWNGDKLANLLLTGLLKQDLLSGDGRVAFQKAVAMVDQPDVSYRFFTEMAHALTGERENESTTLTRLRQLYVCLWVLFVWAREADNLEAPFRASELALLLTWDVCRTLTERDDQHAKSCMAVFDEMLRLHLLISGDLLERKILPYADKRFALSMAVGSHSSVDVNLALYETLGRVCLFGLWKHWLAEGHPTGEERSRALEWRDQSLRMAVGMINANPGLLSPIRDDFAIEIALFMMLADTCERVGDVTGFLTGMAHRLRFSLQRRGAYPITSRNYYDLVEHPVDRSDGYFENNTKGSVLYPLLITWLDAIGADDARSQLTDVLIRDLEHCTQQVWLPDSASENQLWSGNREHGVAIPGLDLREPTAYEQVLQKACEDHPEINEMTALKIGLWPILLAACRHYRMPIPPQLWFLSVLS